MAIYLKDIAGEFYEVQFNKTNILEADCQCCGGSVCFDSESDIWDKLLGYFCHWCSKETYYCKLCYEHNNFLHMHGLFLFCFNVVFKCRLP